MVENPGVSQQRPVSLSAMAPCYEAARSSPQERIASATLTYELNEPVGAPCRREHHATLFRPI